MFNAATTPARSCTILLADDNEALRVSMRTALLRLGYQVIEAADGVTLNDQLASRLHRGSLPDLIVSDVRMPWTSGLLVLERLRSSGCVVPVLLMTAYGDGATRAAAQRLGARILEKPFSLACLSSEISSLVPLPASPL